MFTGLVSELGKVNVISRQNNSFRLTINANKTLQDLKIGDSVAVNGACLTVVLITKDSFTVDVMPETAKNTAISSFKIGDSVNLERTVRVGDRLDGHIVTGHIDFTGTILQVKKDDIARIITIKATEAAMRYIVMKGSVAIDGISLTVCLIEKDYFGVSIIPHTVQNTALGYKNKGDIVNIETDILGRYVERLLGIKEENFKETLFKNGFLEG